MGKEQPWVVFRGYSATKQLAAISLPNQQPELQMQTMLLKHLMLQPVAFASDVRN